VLADNPVGDIHPPWRRVEECFHGGDLAEDQDRQRIEVDPVNPALDDEIANHAEKNQRVHASWRKDERQCGKTAKGRVEERAGSDQHQASMELRLPAPINGEGKGHGEAGNIHRLDNGEGRGVEWVVLLDGEPYYADGGPGADDDNKDGQSNTEPAKPTMQADVVGAHQRGLHNEEHNPRGEHNRVDVQDKGWERRGMDEVVVDGVAESVDHSRSNQQRHEEIKVLTPKTPTRGRHPPCRRVRARAHLFRRIIAQTVEWLRAS